MSGGVESGRLRMWHYSISVMQTLLRALSNVDRWRRRQGRQTPVKDTFTFERPSGPPPVEQRKTMCRVFNTVGPT